MIIFYLKISAIECLFSQEFQYLGRDWNTGERWSIPLKEQIKYRQFLKEKNAEKYFQFFY